MLLILIAFYIGTSLNGDNSSSEADSSENLPAININDSTSLKTTAEASKGSIAEESKSSSSKKQTISTATSSKTSSPKASSSKKAVSSAIPKGENQISEQYADAIDAFEYQNEEYKEALTLKVSVDGKATPMAATI